MSIFNRHEPASDHAAIKTLGGAFEVMRVCGFALEHLCNARACLVTHTDADGDTFIVHTPSSEAVDGLVVEAAQMMASLLREVIRVTPDPKPPLDTQDEWE